MSVSLGKKGNMNGDRETLGNTVWTIFPAVEKRDPNIHHCLTSAERMASKPEVYRSFRLQDNPFLPF